MTSEVAADPAAPTSGAEDSGAERWLRWLPSALLVAVACHQIVLAHTLSLAPWSGGGFGMFSTTDTGGTRHLHAFVLRPGLRREIAATSFPRDLVRRALTLPSDRNLERLAAVVLELPTADHGPASGVEIQVWATRHAPFDRAPESRLLRAATHPVGED